MFIFVWRSSNLNLSFMPFAYFAFSIAASLSVDSDRTPDCGRSTLTMILMLLILMTSPLWTIHARSPIGTERELSLLFFISFDPFDSLLMNVVEFKWWWVSRIISLASMVVVPIAEDKYAWPEASSGKALEEDLSKSTHFADEGGDWTPDVCKHN